MDEVGEEETMRKKARRSLGSIETSAGGSSDFRPFQYEGKNFSDFARGIYGIIITSF